MEILTFVLILIILYFIYNYSPLHCLFNPIGCMKDNINSVWEGIQSFFDGFNKLPYNPVVVNKL